MWALDRLQNLVAGLAGDRDKSNASAYVFTPISPEQLAAAYRSDWIARKVVDIPAFDMVRAWRDWQAEEGEISDIENEERRLKLRQRVAQALKWARLFGGSAIILGVSQGNPIDPLNVATIGKGGINHLHVVTRHQITPGALDRDPLSPTFGEPTTYFLMGGKSGSVEIDASRVIRFVGPDGPIVYGTDDGWGDSVLQAVDDAVKQAATAAQGVAGLVLEAKVDVFKVKGLTANVGNAEYRGRMIERFRLANLAKSTVNALIMDDEEGYEQKQINFQTLPDILRTYMEIAAGAADIPATRLLGVSPKGMNATGESDLRNYYDRVSSEQEMFLRPNMERLDEVLIRSALGSRPDAIYWEWAPLWQTSETEKAANAKARAETTQVYVATGLVPREALAASLRNQLIEEGTYPGIETAWVEGTIGEAPKLPPPPGGPPGGAGPFSATGSTPASREIN